MEILGDESIIATVIENVHQRLPDCEIYGFTKNPNDTLIRHGIISFSIRPNISYKLENNIKKISNTIESKDSFTAKFISILKNNIKRNVKAFSILKNLKKTIINGLKYSVPEIIGLTDDIRNIKGFKLLIIAGSQQLIDYVGNGPWAQPYNLFKWTIIARLFGVKVAYLSVGAGPIQTRAGRFFLKTALCLANYRSYRDQTSAVWIHNINLKKTIDICPDLAFGSSTLIKSCGELPGNNDEKLVGINLVPLYDSNYWIGGGEFACHNYINKIALFSLWLFENGYKVQLFPTQLRLDPKVILDTRGIIEKCLKTNIYEYMVETPINTLDELMFAINSMKFVVASRYHACVLAYLLNKPVIGVAYQPKTTDLMHIFGQLDYAVNIHNFEVEDLKEKFKKIERYKDQEKLKIKQNLFICREMVDRQYESIINMI